jgi:hypothetical protein
MKKNGLSVPHELQVQFRAQGNVGKTTFSAKEDRIIKEKYLSIPIKELAKQIDRSFTGVMGRINAMGLELPAEVREERKRIGMFKGGHQPANKGMKQIDYMSKDAILRTAATRFKKGHLPVNTLKDGAITIRHEHKDRHSRAYKYIRVSLSKWIPLHIYKWQKKHGKIPEGKCLWFKDGNSLNCTLKNLELISRDENLRRNQEEFRSLPPELQNAKTLLKKLNKTIYGKEQVK